MPRLDKTGPDGMGPMTGRGRGDCPQGGRRTLGLGRRQCVGCRAERFWAPKDSIDDLKEVESQLVQDLEDIRDQIKKSEE